MSNNTNVKLIFTPEVIVTAEQASSVLGINIQKANLLLSSADTPKILETALFDGLQAALLNTLQQMVRQRWPLEPVPVRVDCTVTLPQLPEMVAIEGL